MCEGGCPCLLAARSILGLVVIGSDKELMQSVHSSYRDCFTVSMGLDGNKLSVLTHKAGQTTQRK